jgi:hypothetical protein
MIARRITPAVYARPTSASEASFETLRNRMADV